MTFLTINGVDVSHSRLVDLTKLADQSEAFYDWIETQFQIVLRCHLTLDEILKTVAKEDIKTAMQFCYSASETPNLPMLFDGIGRSYPHTKACYYFFSWIIRDAPQQRLAPLIQRIVKASGENRIEIETEVLASLICKYRSNVKTFTWDAIREVMIDRLEGSRRSIKGHEKEVIVRTALLTAIQNYYLEHGNYGRFAGVEIVDKQVMVGNESFDVSINLFDERQKFGQRILAPIKTRETEGGGHAHLFTRDIMSAINAARYDNPDDFLIVVIIARNWSDREADNIRAVVDFAAIFDLSPNEFNEFSHGEQERLNEFIASLLDGRVFPKGTARH